MVIWPLRPTDASRTCVERSRRRARDPALVLAEHNEGGVADASPEIEKSIRRGPTCDHVGTGLAQVILVPFFMRAGLPERGGRRAGGGGIPSVCPAAAEHGVTLCFEGSLPAERIASIAARVGSDAFGCYFDLANPLAHKGLDAPTEIRRSVGSSNVPREGHAGSHGRLPAWHRPRRLRGMRARALRDRLRRLAHPRDAARAAAARLRDLSFTRSVFSELDGTPRSQRLGAFSTEFGKASGSGLPTSSIDWASGPCSSWGRSWTVP